MLLLTDIIAITIALMGSIFALVMGGRAYAALYRENKQLRKQVAELEFSKTGW